MILYPYLGEELSPMFQIADWSQRKREIAAAFRQATPLPAEADDEFYTDLLHQIGVVSNQDRMLPLRWMP